MTVPKAPRWYLTPTSPVIYKWGGVILKYMEPPPPPVIEFRMVLKAIAGPRGPREDWKRALSLGRVFQENGTKCLWNVFCMTDQQLVPVNYRLRPMNSPYVHCHQARINLYYLVWAGYPSSQPLTVRFPPDHALPSHCLL